jgi:MFS family permease
MASMGIGLGPLMGGLLLEWFDWSSVFLLNVPVALIAIAAGAVLVPNSRDPEPGAFDIPGALLSIAALSALVYGVIEAPDEGWGSTLILGCFGAFALLAAAFVRWELHTAQPMLNLSFFRNPRFSIASASIGLAFFSLFGSIFALTQFLQDAKGYSALEAGAAMVPLAGGMVLGAVTSIKLNERLGTARVVTAGLLGLGGLLGTSLWWSVDMPYWPLGVWFFAVAVAMGWVMGPATDSVMGAVPEEKSGVASAMNDVTRQVGGALGTAVIGSLITSLYGSRVSDSVAELPAHTQSLAEDSIGQANAVAAHLPAAEGARLADAAADAFTQALGIGFGVAGAAALVAAVVVKLWLPDRHRERTAALQPAPQAA